MGLFSKLFNFIKVRYVYSGTSSRSAPFNKEAYEQEIVRAVIDCIATHAAKAEAMHVVLDKDGRIKEIKRNSPYVKLLNQRPNPLMTGFDLKYKLVTHVEANTTAMCYVKWSGTLPDMMIPIQYDSFEILPIDGGGYAVQFTDYDGIQRALNIEDVVILGSFSTPGTLGGRQRSDIQHAIHAKASDEGLMQAFRFQTKSRLLKQKKTMFRRKTLQRQQQFTARFEKAAKEGGIVGVDSMEEYAPLTVTPWSANAAQMKKSERISSGIGVYRMRS